MSKELTEGQKKFLDALFGEADGDPALATKLAGYAPDSQYWLQKALSEEILERTTKELVANAPRAAKRIVATMGDGAAELGAANKLAAAKEVLDRIGIVKKDKLEVDTKGQQAIIILPAKQPVEINDDPETKTTE